MVLQDAMTTLPLPSPLRTALPPLPALPWPGALPVVSPTLARTLLLALLLHVWLVLLLGNAPGGTAQPGQGVWGAINVTLRGPETPGEAQVTPPPVPTGPAGTAELPRWGGTVREAAPATPEPPGAAQLGEWAATAPPAAPEARLALPDTPAAPTPALPADPATSPLPLPALPAPLPLSALPQPLAAPAPPDPAPAAERRFASALAAAPVPAAPPLKPPVAAATVPLTWPTAPALAEPLAAVPEARPSPVLAPSITAATSPVPALAPAPAPAAAPALAAARALAPLAAPAALPEPELSRLSRPVPMATAPVAPLQPADRPASELSAPAVSTPAMPALGPNPVMPASGGEPGRPDAGSQVGRDIATPPASVASTPPPRLNLQLARPRGGELSRFSAPGVLPLLPRPPELPDKLAEDIARAAKKDCRTAYQGAGLLAVVPLAAEALRKDSGCKW